MPILMDYFVKNRRMCQINYPSGANFHRYLWVSRDMVGRCCGNLCHQLFMQRVLMVKILHLHPGWKETFRPSQHSPHLRNIKFQSYIILHMLWLNLQPEQGVCWKLQGIEANKSSPQIHFWSSGRSWDLKAKKGNNNRNDKFKKESYKITYGWDHTSAQKAFSRHLDWSRVGWGNLSRETLAMTQSWS